MPCRINRRQLWQARLLLEGYGHAFSCFVTLTYAPEHLPEDMSVSPRAVQLFLKRLRKKVGPVRYFAVGEYGDMSARPHYHLILYGCSDVKAITDCWPYGHVKVGTLTSASARYVCGYVTKKMTKADDPRLKGRLPEFARMSLRPGIGANAAQALLRFMQGQLGEEYMRVHKDVPAAVRLEGSMLPIGRYIRNVIRKELGMEPRQSDEARELFCTALQLKLGRSMDRERSEKQRKADGIRAAQRVRFAREKGKVL